MNEKQRALLNWLTFLANPAGTLTNTSLSIYTAFAGVAPGLCTVQGGELDELQPVAPPQRLERTFAPGTKVHALKIASGGTGDAYWFPYIERGVGEVDIPKNVPVGTVALTAGMNGCSLRIYEHTAFDLLRFCHDNNGNYVDHDALTARGFHHLLSVNASARTRGAAIENINNYWHTDFDTHLNSGVYFISLKTGANEWKVFKSAHTANRRFELVPARWMSKSYTIVHDHYEGSQRHNGLVTTLAIPVAAPVVRTRTASLSGTTPPAPAVTRGRAGSF